MSSLNLSIYIQSIKNCIQNKQVFAFYILSDNLESDDINSDEPYFELIRIYPSSIDESNLILYDSLNNKWDINNMHPFTDFTEFAFDAYSECMGCRYGLGNQEAHYKENNNGAGCF